MTGSTNVRREVTRGSSRLDCRWENQIQDYENVSTVGRSTRQLSWRPVILIT